MNIQRFPQLSKVCCKYYALTNIAILTRKSVNTLSCPSNRLKLNHILSCNKIGYNYSYITAHKTSTFGGNAIQRELTWFGKLVDKLKFTGLKKSRLNAIGYLLYESIADRINYVKFFEEFGLPDTFYSWFAITEMHVWMLSVRCMAEGEDGRFIRNRMVHAMWSDVRLRAKQLGASNPAGLRRQINELSEQFQASLIGYDEGLQLDDTVLAGTLWRRMYQQSKVDPENLELLVKYIRKQIRLLDNVTREQLYSRKSIPWDADK